MHIVPYSLSLENAAIFWRSSFALFAVGSTPSLISSSGFHSFILNPPPPTPLTLSIYIYISFFFDGKHLMGFSENCIFFFGTL